MNIITLGMINLDPHYGSMLGGTGVIVTGDQIELSEDDDIMCIFDGNQVRGVYVSNAKALCISPILERRSSLYVLRETTSSLEKQHSLHVSNYI